MKIVNKIPLLGLSVGLVLASSLGVAAEVATQRAGAKLRSECIAADAYKTTEACPEGPKQFGGKVRHKTAFKSAPPPRERKERKDDLGARNASEQMAAGQRDARQTRLQARSRALLITEIQGLERLYKQTPEKSKDRPQLVRRLAEGYVELESAANRDMIESDIKADDAKAKKQRKTFDSAKKESAKAKKILQEARKKAILFYRIMKRDYPDYSKYDEILYYLAYEYEQAGELDEARKVYLELIEKSPKSKYVPNAYLAFGELFFNEAMGDPTKWQLAASAYEKVTEYPPPDNKVYGYARYKLAYVHWNNNDLGKAIEEFAEVIKYGDKFPKMPNASQLQKAARRDLVPVYAVAGDPKKAYNFFRPLSGDEGGSTEKTLDMLNDLGLAYMDTGHYPEGIVLYEELISRDKGDRLCAYQTQITHAIQAMKSGDKVAIRKELDKQLDLRAKFKEGKRDKKAVLDCDNRTAELLSETAMSWHLEAVGTGGTRGTGDKETMALASQLYQKVVDNFTQDEFETFEFPRIVKEDWPNIYKIKYAMADLLYVQERWEDCGPAFDAVVAENPNSPEAPEAAYASVLCYQKMYDQTHKGDDKKGMGQGPTDARGSKATEAEWEKFKPKTFTDMQKGMIQAFNRYVCYIKPPEGNKQAYDQYVEVKYARARTYFEAQHWEEAAVAFRDVALNHSDHDSATYAAQLYLESINVVGSKSKTPKPACYEDMGEDVPAFLELYCGEGKYENNKEQCDLLTRIQCDVKRLRAEKMVELADKGGGTEALTKYKEAGDAYIEIWRTYGEQQLAAGGESQCGAMEEVLYNAAQAYQAGRLLAKAISVRRLLLSPQYKLNETELAKKSLYQLGRNYQAIAVYDQAAGFFMKYAEATEYKGEDADKAVSDSVVLNLGLGRDEEAIEAASAFNRNYGRRKPAEAAQIAFAIGAHYGEKEDWKEVKNKLAGGALALIDKQATLDVKVQAHALLAHAHQLTGSDGPAKAEYAKVVGAWKDPVRAAKEIEAQAGDSATKQRQLGRALTAVGEAMYFFAEEKRARVEAVKFPAYKGSGERDDVLKHINTKVKDWIGKKKPLIDDASAEYKKIVDLQPLPPPKWVIAAGARVGSMWSKFVEEFRSAPIPKSMSQDDEIRTAYYSALDEASEPLKQIGKGAYKTCLEYSVTYQYFDEFSRSCEEWLAENYKAEFHLIDEFSGAPNRVNSVLREKPYPLKANGDVMLIATEEAPPAPAKAADNKPAAEAPKDTKKK